MSKISSKEKIKIKIQLKYVKNADHYKRLCTILAWDRGREVLEIADVLQIPQSTVYRYIKEYKDDTKGSNDQKGGSSSKLDLDQEKEMIDHLEHTTYLYVKDICQYVEKKYAIRYSQSGMKDWLKRHWFTYKKPKKVPGKLDPKKQEGFIEEYEKLKKELKPDEEIYFIDAVHPQHQSEALCGWIKKGSEKTLQTTGKQLRLHFCGAICLNKMSCFIKEYNTVDADAMIDFFSNLEKQSDASKIYVILDNARANKNKKLTKFLETSKIEMKYLPPYSPNLNAIERLWKVMREKKIYNRYYESCLDFFREIRGFFQKDIPKMMPQLKSRINDNFEIIKLNPINCAFSI